MQKLDASGLSPDAVRRLVKEARELAEDRQTPGNASITLSACADTLESLFVKRKPIPRTSDAERMAKGDLR